MLSGAKHRYNNFNVREGNWHVPTKAGISLPRTYLSHGRCMYSGTAVFGGRGKKQRKVVAGGRVEEGRQPSFFVCEEFSKKQREREMEGNNHNGRLVVLRLPLSLY